jgi:hypothetical protein
VLSAATDPGRDARGAERRLRPEPGTRGVAVTLAAALLAGTLATTGGCGGAPTEPTPGFDLAPFKEMARRATCAGQRNRLFLIDRMLVFWDRADRCPDFSYQQTLYGETVDDVLCIYHDSIAGPVKTCQDSRYAGLFETVITSLDKPNLGLGSDHQVEPIPF